MRMNKRGAEADLGSNLVVIFIVILSAFVIGGMIYLGGQSGKAVFSQAPNDVSAIATACKFVAESGVAVLSSPYCIQAREVNYNGFLGFIGGKKQFVNCPYALSNKWFTLAEGKTAPTSCDSGWAKGYCETLKSTQGTKYKDTVVVNGRPCGGSVTPNWDVTGTSSSGTIIPTTSTNTKSCLELGGEFVDSTGKCPTAKSVKRTDHIDIGPGQEVCCVAASTA